MTLGGKDVRWEAAGGQESGGVRGAVKRMGTVDGELEGITACYDGQVANGAVRETRQSGHDNAAQAHAA